MAPPNQQQQQQQQRMMRGEYYGEGEGAEQARQRYFSSSRPTDRRHGGSRAGRGRRRYGGRDAVCGELGTDCTER